MHKGHHVQLHSDYDIHLHMQEFIYFKSNEVWVSPYVYF